MAFLLGVAGILLLRRLSLELHLVVVDGLRLNMDEVELAFLLKSGHKRVALE